MKKLFALLLLATSPAAAADWPHVTADDGSIYAVVPTSIGRPGGGWAAASVCQIDVDGHHCVGGDAWVMSARILWFDCKGHYADMTNPPSTGWQVAAPLSIARAYPIWSAR
jgi:hypothetical protein